jgi:hypothetical protein
MPFLAANVGLINLDRAVDLAERRKIALAHRFEDAMGQEPRRLNNQAERVSDLVRTDAILATRY